MAPPSDSRSSIRARLLDEASRAFAQRFGFLEVDREVEQTRNVAAAPAVPDLPEGVEVVTSADRPGLWCVAFERFGREALAGFAVDTPLDINPEQWSTTWAGDPMFLAVSGGEVIGCAGLLHDPDQSTRAENALTAVRRDWRGRGIAVHLKLRTLEWAAAHGIDGFTHGPRTATPPCAASTSAWATPRPGRAPPSPAGSRCAPPEVIAAPAATVLP